ncbi:MAG: hypothetical protein O2887_16905 [Bacteroidetes bacterium]|nr:hypothetical protein [Bacteroidota bacterium]MDA1122140.1 hypothetical protein [Bacteroidota bacterium]
MAGSEMIVLKSIQSADEGMDFQIASAMCSLSFSNHVHLRQLPGDEQELSSARKLNELQLAYLSAFYLNHHRKALFNEVYFFSRIKQKSLDELENPTKVNFKKYEN